MPAKSAGNRSEIGRRSPLKTRAMISRGRTSLIQGLSLDKISQTTTPKLYTSLAKEGVPASSTFSDKKEIKCRTKGNGAINYIFIRKYFML